MVDRFYGDCDHHEKMGHTVSYLCECYSYMFYYYACLDDRSRTNPRKFKLPCPPNQTLHHPMPCTIVVGPMKLGCHGFPWLDEFVSDTYTHKVGELKKVILTVKDFGA